MEAAVSIGTKRRRNKNTNWKLCVLCQIIKKNDKRELE